MFGYICLYKGRRLEVYAKSKYEAQELAAKRFKAKRSYEVSAMLAEKDGKAVVHDTSELT